MPQDTNYPWSIRLSKEKREFWHKCAKKRGMNLKEYISALVNEDAKRLFPKNKKVQQQWLS